MNKLILLLLIGFCMSVLPVLAEDTIAENVSNNVESAMHPKEVKFYDENGNIYLTIFSGYSLEDTDYLIEQGLLSTSPPDKQQEYSPLDTYLDTLYSAVLNYSSGKTTYDELLCEIYGTEFLMKNDYHVIEFLSSKNTSEIKKMQETTLRTSDWENGMQESDTIRLLNDMIDFEESPDKIVTHYEIQGNKSFIIYFTIIERKKPKNKLGEHHFDANKIIDVSIITPSNLYLTEPKDAYKCLLPYKQSTAILMIEYTDEAIAEAKRNGTDTSGAESLLSTSHKFYNQGQYMNSYNFAQWSLLTVEGARDLKNYRALSETEKIRFIEDTVKEIPKEQNIESDSMGREDEEILTHIGSNIQFNVYMENESNPFFTTTQIIDPQNNTVTIYNNQLVGEYDMYTAIDYTMLYELWLMDEAGESGLDYINRMTVALMDGDIKIKPFWKVYKIREFMGVVSL